MGTRLRGIEEGIEETWLSGDSVERNRKDSVERKLSRVGTWLRGDSVEWGLG